MTDVASDRDDQSSTTAPLRIAVVGAGPAGATCGQALASVGHSVELFDKGRGPGGRSSTRRSGDVPFDHGPISLTADDESFEDQLLAWEETGVVERWIGKFAADSEDGKLLPFPMRRWVGVPGMSGIVSHLLGDLPVRFDQRVNQLSRSADGWTLSIDDHDDAGPFDRVVLALPAPQAAELLQGIDDDLASAVGRVRMLPCWAAMLVVEGGDVPADYLELIHHPVLQHAALNSSKPGRPDTPNAWVLHARHDWSIEHLENDRDTIGQTLADAFFDLIDAVGGMRPTLIKHRAHRWRYAEAKVPYGAPCDYNDARDLVVCGDWMLGHGIAEALRSGEAAARALA